MDAAEGAEAPPFKVALEGLFGPFGFVDVPAVPLALAAAAAAALAERSEPIAIALGLPAP